MQKCPKHRAELLYLNRKWHETKKKEKKFKEILQLYPIICICYSELNEEEKKISNEAIKICAVTTSGITHTHYCLAILFSR